jgi:DNA-directed RNA polymerase II subunit RPB1
MTEQREIERVQFGIINPNELLGISVVKVEIPIGFMHGVPCARGLMDTRLGAIGRMKCSTCDETESCPGHFGHVELAKPMYNHVFIRYVHRVLQCVCYNCSRILCASDRGFEAAWKIKSNKKRFDAMHRMCTRHSRCGSIEEDDGDDEEEEKGDIARAAAIAHGGGCGFRQPKILRDGLGFSVELHPSTCVGDADPRKKPLEAKKAREIFEKMSDEARTVLGFDLALSRPEWMILTVLPIPPPCVRPSVSMDDIHRSEDDLTLKLADIVRCNNELRRMMERGTPDHAVRETELLLQFHLSTYFNNELPGQPQAKTRSGRPLKTLTQRLKGKEGRIRGNLMGKRVDFSARTVITPDPNIDLDQVGVPRSIAMTLTFPEMVTPFNLERLRRSVGRGAFEYPGARFIRRGDGTTIDISCKNAKVSELRLEVGDVVERHLQDGDLVVFNRQPSLHKMSMMGHRVKVMSGSSFRLNLSATTPYNADFDGDEMNLHVPQNHEARAEARELMAVSKQIVTPASNRPIMSIVQDALLGSMLLTSRGTFVERDDAMNMAMWMPSFEYKMPIPAILKPRRLWTGKQMFSMILPNINVSPLRLGPSLPQDNVVVIDQGELLTGVLDSKTLGRASGGIVHVIWKDHGPEAATQFISQCQKVVNHWLLHRGFSVGIGDSIADKKTSADIVATLRTAKDAVTKLISDAQNGDVQALPGRSLGESFEMRVNKELNSAVDTAGKSAQCSLKDSNGIKEMVVAGSKGSFINISQMMACVGQQNVDGKRVPFGFDGSRTLPHFLKGDLGPESKGFVQNSYLSGLTPQEFFFHAMGGREGLIDTAVKTSDTGYIQRRLMKAMEDVQSKYDGTVRNSSGTIVQFLYGDDGMDGAHIERQPIDTLRMDDSELRAAFAFDCADPERGCARGTLEVDIVDDIRTNEETQRILAEEYEQLRRDREFLRMGFKKCDEGVFIPVNVRRIIATAQKIFHTDASVVTDLHPKKVVEGVRWLIDELSVVDGSDDISVEMRANSIMLFSAFLRCNLASKRITMVHRLRSAAFDWVLGEAKAKFFQALVHPGEMVGAIAAQSIGEPATQMTLNTFHFAGVSSKNVTLGVPRLREILNVSKHPKTPSLTIYLSKGPSSTQGGVKEDDEEEEEKRAKRMQSVIEHTTLQTVVEVSEIYYDPDPNETVVEKDKDLVRSYVELGMGMDGDASEGASPWVLRYTISREAMIDRDITMDGLADIVNSAFEGDVNIMVSNDNADELVLRVRVLSGGGNSSTSKGGDDAIDYAFIRDIDAILMRNLTLRGVPEIKKAFMRKEKVPSFEAGSVRDEEWIIDTEGTNLGAVLAIDGVDMSRTYSNDILEVQNVLGIEAARGALQRELHSVISFDGSYINQRHIDLLSDIMTTRGALMAITRHGINCTENGPLMRASFEESVEQLTVAAAFSESDDAAGVSQSIMMGKLPQLGTGSFDLILDMKALNGATVPCNEFDDIPVEFDYSSAMEPTREASPARSAGLRYSPEYSPISGLDGAFDLRGSDASFSPQATDISSSSPASPAYSMSMSSPSYTESGGGSSNSLASMLGSLPDRLHSSIDSSNFMRGYDDDAWSRSRFDRSSISSPSYHCPSSPSYTPSRPGLDGCELMNPCSPTYDPIPQHHQPPFVNMCPSSPSYFPRNTADENRSPGYSPSSPSYNDHGMRYSPTSPAYSPTRNQASPAYSPSSPAYSPSSPTYSPSSPTYTPSSPSYTPSSPAYTPSSPTFTPTRSQIHRMAYSPTSPSYWPDKDDRPYSPSRAPCVDDPHPPERSAPKVANAMDGQTKRHVSCRIADPSLIQ